MRVLPCREDPRMQCQPKCFKFGPQHFQIEDSRAPIAFHGLTRGKRAVAKCPLDFETRLRSDFDSQVRIV